MRYVDAEKLIAEIERLKERAQAERVLHPKTILAAKDYFLIQDYDKLLSFITSLQQEQPETDGDDGKFVKILVRKEFAEQFQKLADEIQAGQSSFIGALNWREQPEVDLDEEIKSYFKGFGKFPSVGIADCIDIAKYFYELGLNARKEE